MRSLLLLILLVPVLAAAQINRSARELASEQVREYITTRLFKDRPYKPVSFGEIKNFNEKRNVEIAWMIEHKFEITDSPNGFDKRPATTKEYKFLFYLDDKMKVIRADSYFKY